VAEKAHHRQQLTMELDWDLGFGMGTWVLGFGLLSECATSLFL